MAEAEETDVLLTVATRQMNLPTQSLGSRKPGKTRRSLALLTAAALAFGLAGWAVFSVDSDVSTWFQAGKLPGDLRRAVTLSEAFAHGLGAAFILGAVWLSVAPERRHYVKIAILITLLSGLAANAMKASFIRVRPHSADDITVVQEPNTPVTSAKEDNIAADNELLNALPGSKEQVEPDFWDSRQRSFPSGHSATAWGLAIGLSLAFPRACIVFVSLAVLASIQRLTSGAHFPSDVFAGAVIACLSAIAILIVSSRNRAEANLAPTSDHEGQVAS